MKVSFTGAQSTGKTTLLEAIKQNEEFRYKYEFIDEITRRMIKKGLKINEEDEADYNREWEQARMRTVLNPNDSVTRPLQSNT